MASNRIAISTAGLDKRDRPRAAALLWHVCELAAAQPDPSLAAWLERLARAVEPPARKAPERRAQPLRPPLKC